MNDTPTSDSGSHFCRKCNRQVASRWVTLGEPTPWGFFITSILMGVALLIVACSRDKPAWWGFAFGIPLIGVPLRMIFTDLSQQAQQARQCTVCDHIVTLEDAGFMAATFACPACSGTGKKSQELAGSAGVMLSDCEKCGGSGRLPK